MWSAAAPFVLWFLKLAVLVEHQQDFVGDTVHGIVAIQLPPELVVFLHIFQVFLVQVSLLTNLAFDIVQSFLIVWVVNVVWVNSQPV